MPDSARDAAGTWRVNRRLLALSAVLLGVAILSVWPLELLPSPWYADSILHFLAGVALAFGAAAVVPVRDDVLVVAVILLGIVWEPLEWSWFRCWAGSSCTADNLSMWMSSNDTIKDMALVALGAVAAMIGLGRYH